MLCVRNEKKAEKSTDFSAFFFYNGTLRLGRGPGKLQGSIEKVRNRRRSEKRGEKRKQKEAARGKRRRGASKPCSAPLFLENPKNSGNPDQERGRGRAPRGRGRLLYTPLGVDGARVFPASSAKPPAWPMGLTVMEASGSAGGGTPTALSLQAWDEANRQKTA